MVTLCLLLFSCKESTDITGVFQDRAWLFEVTVPSLSGPVCRRAAIAQAFMRLHLGSSCLSSVYGMERGPLAQQLCCQETSRQIFVIPGVANTVSVFSFWLVHSLVPRALSSH